MNFLKPLQHLWCRLANKFLAVYELQKQPNYWLQKAQALAAEIAECAELEELARRDNFQMAGAT